MWNDMIKKIDDEIENDFCRTFENEEEKLETLLSYLPDEDYGDYLENKEFKNCLRERTGKCCRKQRSEPNSKRTFCYNSPSQICC